MKKIFINSQKICAVITSVCFTFTVLSSNLFASVNINTLQEQQDLFVAKNTEQLNSLFLDNYCKISESTDNLSSTVVVNIQDLHCDYSVQKNIYSLIDELNKKYKINKIYVEGAYKNFDFELLKDINPMFKESLIEDLLKDSEITASEYYALKTNNENKLYAVEDKNVYLQNIERLKNILNNKEQNLQYLANIDKEIEYLRIKHLNNENEELSNIISDYENGDLEQYKYFKTLMDYSEKFDINPQNYKNMMSYLGLSDENNTINYGQLKQEIIKTITELKNTLNYEQFSNIKQATNDFQNIIEFKNVIVKYNEQYQKDLFKDTPNLKIYMDLKEKTVAFNPLELIKEEKKLTNAIRVFLSKNKTELEIAYLCDFKKYFKGYVLAQLTPAQWNYVKTGIDTFVELYSRYSILNDVTKMQNQFAMLNDFYEVNDKRNEIFVKNMNLQNFGFEDVLSKNNNPEQILNSAKEIVVLVSGGYHTEGVNEILNKKRISHITLRPNLSNSKFEYASNKYDTFAKNMIEEQKIALPLMANQTNKSQLEKIAGHFLKGKHIDGVTLEMLADLLRDLYSGKIEVNYDSQKGVINFVREQYTDKDGNKKSAFNISIDVKGFEVEADAIVSSLQQRDESSYISKTGSHETQYVKEYIFNAAKKLKTATGDFGQEMFLPKKIRDLYVYKVNEQLCLFIANNKLYIGDGEIWKLANTKDKKDIKSINPKVYAIDKIDRAYLPDAMQELLSVQEQQEETTIEKLQRIENRVQHKYLTLDGKKTKAEKSFIENNKDKKTEIFVNEQENKISFVRYDEELLPIGIDKIEEIDIIFDKILKLDVLRIKTKDGNIYYYNIVEDDTYLRDLLLMRIDGFKVSAKKKEAYSEYIRNIFNDKENRKNNKDMLYAYANLSEEEFEKKLSKTVKKKPSKIVISVLTKVISFIMIISSMVYLVSCSTQKPTQAPYKEIVEYINDSDINFSKFLSDTGYLAYFNAETYLSREEISRLNNEDRDYLNNLVNTYDQALVSISYLKMGKIQKARDALLLIQNNLATSYNLTYSSGRDQILYTIYNSNKEGEGKTGEIVWAGLAALQYKLVTGSNEFDNLIISVDRYLGDRKVSDCYVGTSNKNLANGGWASSEHQLDIIAYFTLKSLLSNKDWKTIITEDIKEQILPGSLDIKDATNDQVEQCITLSKAKNEEILLDLCDSFYENFYNKEENMIKMGYKNDFKVLDTNTWVIFVISMLEQYNPSIYNKSKIKNIDLNSILKSIEENFAVKENELQKYPEEYKKYKGYRIYSSSSEHFIDGKLNWNFEWSMQVATAYYLMGDYERAEEILNDAQKFSENVLNLPKGMLPASSTVTKVYSYYGGWMIYPVPSVASTVTGSLLEYAIKNADSELANPFSAKIKEDFMTITETYSNILTIFSFQALLKGIIFIKNQIVNGFRMFVSSFVFGNYNMTDKSYGILKIINIASAICFLVIFWNQPVFAIPAVISFMLYMIGIISFNAGVRVFVSFKYLKSAELLYGKENVELTEKGVQIKDTEKNIPIYVINDVPGKAETFNFKPVPIKIKNNKGEFVKCWLGRYNDAVVVFAESVDYESIVEQFTKTKQFESLCGKKTPLKANVEVIEVDATNESDGKMYSKSGNPLINYNLIKDKNFLEVQQALLYNKKVEAVTINQNIAVFIDDSADTISTSNDMLSAINLYVQSDGLGTNAKILFTDSYIDKIIDLLEKETGKEQAKSEFRKIINRLKEENKEISIIFEQTDGKNLEKYFEYGIFSYIANGEYVDSVSSIKSKVKVVSDLSKVDGFDGSLSVLKVSELKKGISNTSGIFTFLNSTLNIKEIIEKRNLEFVKQAAANFTSDQIPNNIDINKIAKLLVSQDENKFEQLSQSLKETDSISIFYKRISNKKEQEVFVNAILERILVVNYLRNFEEDKIYYGLKNKKLESILAKALIEKYKLNQNFDINSTATIQGATQVEVDFELEKQMVQLAKRAFEQEKPDSQAIDDIIKLIPLFADRNVNIALPETNPMDMIQNIRGVLAAA